MSIGVEARLLSNDVLARWLLEDFPFRIQLSEVFPFLPVAGDSLRYATTGVLTPAKVIGDGEAIPDTSSLPRDPNRTHRFAELATQFCVSYRAQDQFSSNVNDQVAVQSALAVRKLLYRFWTLFERGDSTAGSGEFDGLGRLVDTANQIDLQGEPLRLEDLDRGLEQVRANNGRCRLIVTNSIGKRAIHAAHWARGLAPEYEEMRVRRADGSDAVEQVLKFDGAPVYINDLNQVFDPKGAPVARESLAGMDGLDPALSSHIWFCTLGEGCLHGITPEKAANIIVRNTILADASTLVYQLTMPVGIGLGTASALSVIKNGSIPTG